MSSPSISNLPFDSDLPRKNVEPENSAVKSKPGLERSKFTRGEKCLFAHLVVTFSLLVLLLIIYCVHLYLVNHHGDEVFFNFLRGRPVMPDASEEADYITVGLVYVIPDSYMCNSLLLRPRWSLAPGHCAAARSDPDLAYALPSWRILHELNNGRKTDGSEADQYIESQIKRSVPHPHFNSDDFKNNIGLFEHNNPVHLFTYAHISSVPLSDQTLTENANDLQLIGWENSWHLHGHLVQNPVQPFKLENCKQFVSPIVELRAYEHCVTLKTKVNVSIIPGAALAMKGSFVGVFSWGESRGRALPFVILDLAYYNDWITHIVTVLNNPNIRSYD